jgi:hypothetical protein
MSNVFACPVHVDRQSVDPRRPCPLCGQPLILLRAAPTDALAARGDMQQASDGETRTERRGAPVAEGAEQRAEEGSDPAELARELDRAIKMLTRIRNRLRTVA